LPSKLEFTLLTTMCILVVLIPPLLVYFTYPDTGGYETELEETLSDLPIKPPPFLIGSVSYGSHRGRSNIVRPDIQGINSVIYAYWPEKREQIFLILLPYYIDRVNNKIISDNDARSLIISSNTTLLVEVFETHKGIIGIVLEIRLTNQTYSAIKRP